MVTEAQREVVFVASIGVGAVLLFLGIALLTVAGALMAGGVLAPVMGYVIVRADFAPSADTSEGKDGEY